jgi:hypothetical protein
MSNPEFFERVEDVYTDRVLWESIWEEMYEFYVPERFSARSEFLPTNIYSSIYDSTPVMAADKLANTLVSGLVPPWTKWATLGPGPLVPEEDREELLTQLGLVNETLFTFINQSGLARAAQPALLDCVVAGTGCVKIFKRERGFSVRAWRWRKIMKAT